MNGDQSDGQDPNQGQGNVQSDSNPPDSGSQTQSDTQSVFNPTTSTGGDASSLFPSQLSDDDMNGAVPLATTRIYRAPCPGSKDAAGVVIRNTGMTTFVPTNTGTCGVWIAFYDSTGAKSPTAIVGIDAGSQVDLTAEMNQYAYCTMKCDGNCSTDGTAEITFRG
jgi:hypothetical protein